MSTVEIDASQKENVINEHNMVTSGLIDDARRRAKRQRPSSMDKQATDTGGDTIEQTAVDTLGGHDTADQREKEGWGKERKREAKKERERQRHADAQAGREPGQKGSYAVSERAGNR